MDGPDQRSVGNVLRFPQLHGRGEHRQPAVLVPATRCRHRAVRSPVGVAAALRRVAARERLHGEPDAVEEAAAVRLQGGGRGGEEGCGERMR